MRYPLYQGYCLLTNLFTIVIKRFAFLFSKHNRTNKLINKCSSTCFGWCSTWIRRNSKTYVYSHSMERPLVLFLWTFFYCHLQIYDLNRDRRFYVFWYLSKKNASNQQIISWGNARNCCCLSMYKHSQWTLECSHYMFENGLLPASEYLRKHVRFELKALEIYSN